MITLLPVIYGSATPEALAAQTKLHQWLTGLSPEQREELWEEFLEPSKPPQLSSKARAEINTLTGYSPGLTPPHERPVWGLAIKAA